jgi:hypothetical protein
MEDFLAIRAKRIQKLISRLILVWKLNLVTLLSSDFVSIVRNFVYYLEQRMSSLIRS